MEKEDINLETVRKVLGTTCKNMSDEQVQSLISSLQLLIDGWLDMYERSIFKGKTINELLTVKNGSKL